VKLSLWKSLKPLKHQPALVGIFYLASFVLRPSGLGRIRLPKVTLQQKVSGLNKCKRLHIESKPQAINGI